MRRWPWETRKLGEYHYVTRPWRPWEDQRVHAAVWLLCIATVVAAVWRWQGDEAGWLAHKGAAALTTVVLLWMRGLWQAGSPPRRPR